MMHSKRHLPDIEHCIQSSGFNVTSRRARPGLAGLRLHTCGKGSAAKTTPWAKLAAGLVNASWLGYLAHEKTTPPLAPPQEPRHGPTAGSCGVVWFL